MYRQASNISRTLVSNKIVDHSDVVGASPVSAAPSTSSFSINIWLQWIGQKITKRDEEHLSLGIGGPYIRGLTVCVGKPGIQWFI